MNGISSKIGTYIRGVGDGRMAKQERMPLIPPVTAVDELGTIKEALILGLLMTVFDRDIKVLQESKLKTKQPYVDLLQRAMDGVAADLAHLRRRLKEKGIKVTEERRDETGVGCVYWCRGYKASFEMLWHFAKAETEVRMRKYLGEDIRKYVRSDLPEHLKPQWLLASVPLRDAIPLHPMRDGPPENRGKDFPSASSRLPAEARPSSPGQPRAGEASPRSRPAPPSGEQLHDSEHARPDERGGQGEEEPIAVAESEIQQPVDPE